MTTSRFTLDRLTYYSDRPSRTATPPAAVYGECLGRIGNGTVWTVDGEYIRNNIDVDFVAGGHYARYAYIPIGEIWIEKNLSAFDRDATKLHESVELGHMEDGESYDDAHEYACSVEKTFRDKNKGS